MSSPLSSPVAATDRIDRIPTRLNNSQSQAENQSGSQFQLSVLVDYLNRLLTLILSASVDHINSSPIFSLSDSLDRLNRFGCDSNYRAIYLYKVREQHLSTTSGTGHEGSETFQAGQAASDQDPTFSFVYSIKSEMEYTSNTVSTLVVIKRVPTLDCSRPLDDQLHFLNLFGPASSQLNMVANSNSGAVAKDTTSSVPTSTSNPYEELHNLVHLAVAPFFDAYVNSRTHSKNLNEGAIGNPVDGSKVVPGTSSAPAGNSTAGSNAQGSTSANNQTNKTSLGKDSDSKMGIPMTKKKFAELELSLLHLQQNVEIPEITLIIHPIIKNLIERARSEPAWSSKYGTQRMLELLDPSLLYDDKFLNKLQSLVNTWIKEIQNVTNLNRDVESGTASQEINFWLSMEKALQGVEEQLKSEPITLTLDILKTAKRYHTTVSFLADTGLKEASDNVHKYNVLMKDFPLNELLAATELDKIQESLVQIFGHINKKLKVSPYPIRRALPLAEAISKDLTETLLKVLTNHRLMYMEYATFSKVIASTAAVCQTWDEQIKDFTTVARDLTRKRNEKFIPIKINPLHLDLKKRCEYLKGFRKQHEQLRIMTGRDQGISRIGLGATGVNAGDRRPGGSSIGELTDLDMEDEVRAAYESVKNVDVLDTTPEGTQIWTTAEAAYNERVSKVENQIISRLRARLGSARNATEMFRVFSKFNTLFVRPKIRGAIQEYQTQLIDSVKEDIGRLHDKFRMQYRHSEAYPMSQLRDIPPIAGAIIWAKQIERQLFTYMKRVEDVLGRGWENYAEGSRLATDSNNFLKKLDTKPIFDQWVKDWTKRDMSITGSIFEIQRNRSTDVYTLAVAFNPDVIVIFKEVRNLSWLGFNVPYQMNSSAKDAKKVYPSAVSLIESIRTYNQTLTKINSITGIADLVADYRNELCQMISRGLNIKWENFVGSMLDSGGPGGSLSSRIPTSGERESGAGRPGNFVKDLANKVSIFQERTDDLLFMYEDLLKIIDELRTCEFKHETFVSLISRIQKTIDDLSVTGYVNLQQWTKELDQRIESVFEKRLRNIFEVWNQQFSSKAQLSNRQMSGSDPTTNSSGNKVRIDKSVHFDLNPGTVLKKNSGESKPMLMENKLRVAPLVHEIRIKNQVIYLDPPIEAARSNWYKQLHQWLGVICSLTRIQSQRYDLGFKLKIEDTEDKTYLSLLKKLDSETLQKPYSLIEEKVNEISRYIAKWLQFQSLWDLEADYLYGRLGESLSAWQQILSEIRKTRSTFDNSESSQDFGVCVINYEQVQAKVNAKYDMWQKDVLVRFGSKLGAAMRETYGAVTKSRHDLENHSIETSSTAQAVTFITFVQDLKRKVKKWEPEIEIFGSGEKTLHRQRYQFPADWLYVDQIEGEWTVFNELLKRKNLAIQDQLAGLQMKIVAEDKVVRSKIETLLNDWEKEKPISGELQPDIAMNSINLFETRVNRLQEEYTMVCRAKEALDLEHTSSDQLDPVAEEITDLKAVWTALSGIWSQLAELRDTMWSSVTPRKLRQSLETLLAATRDMPSRMRQYQAFEFVQEKIRFHQKSVALVGELKSDALRERHWKMLYKNLRLSGHYSPSQMTLGTIWDMDLKKNESTIRQVLAQATGEVALEEYIKQIKETWEGYVLDLVNYQNKTRLIRGWDDLFNKRSEHSSALSQMKLSPYYKTFEEDATIWTDRLNRMSEIFDKWIDVQRQWVYLEGIFFGNADIKHLLPNESNRFNNINAEYLGLMKRVFKSPYVLDVLQIPEVLKTLDKLVESLGKLQKALGEYLERERSSFPRFYFVGDEDLLEILGNSKDILRVVKHLKKMFAGLSTLIIDPDLTRIEKMCSREGEEVPFSTPIVLKDYPKINDWLTKVESQMQISLAELLCNASEGLETFYTEKDILNKNKFLEWIDTFPAQLVVLAVQVIWTKTVEQALRSCTSLEGPLQIVLRTLDVLALVVLGELQPVMRRKCEHVITELVHQRDVIRLLIKDSVDSVSRFEWLYHMRFYLDVSVANPVDRLSIQMANAGFPYGFEYLGVPDRLVQTPLTDRCYLTLTQALHGQLGGSPFGPAGTGKTESVKALGVQLGRFVLVFCCDETFDFQAMGRIFVGLCQVGAWGCFDEANRLEERILSAVSQQIQSIQQGLRAASIDPKAEVELVGKTLRINPHTGIFITMNPGYAGRSNLPDNLKKLFRSMAMTRPDRELISQVMLFSQGFRTAETLASKVVPFFSLCGEQLSRQPHYDFGLRALKAVLTSAGHLKRARLQAGESDEASVASDDQAEQEILIQSVTETIVPKLVAEDSNFRIPNITSRSDCLKHDLLFSLMSDVFPGIEYNPSDLDKLKEHIHCVASERHLVVGDVWCQKVLQLYQIQNIQHGLMMVGPSATGKTEAWRVLLAALGRLEGREGVSYVIDPKAISKDSLYGTLDPTTREWNDGLFTNILRKIIDNVRGEDAKRHWIIFDGDVDPEWVENLNSVLDDNKLLTLPNGERLNLPDNVRIMFEVESLKYATLATVSRCGMVWFSEDAVTPDMFYQNYLKSAHSVALDAIEDDSLLIEPRGRRGDSIGEVSANLITQRNITKVLAPHFETDGLVTRALNYAASVDHIMEFTIARAVSTLFSLINKTIRNVLDYNARHSDFPLQQEQIEAYATKRLLVAIVWAFTGDSKLDTRAQMGFFLRDHSGLDMPPLHEPGASLIDYDVQVSSGDWVAWQNSVPIVEIDTHQVTASDVVIPTLDTVRHEDVLYSWLSEHKPLMLCGPPGSGKTMTLFSALRKLSDMDVVGLNFSSATTPELVLKTFDQHCEYKKTSTGTVLAPIQIGKWIVIFCDEINLPAADKYGTQKVISFIRQLVEGGGFWRPSDKVWIKLERIQFVGACNPPTDPGRVALSQRFLRHAPLVMVDYPGEASLKQIYGTFNRAVLKVLPSLRGHAEPLTSAMVEFYLSSQKRFTADVQAHYVYSPRELTRWVRGVYESIKPLETLSLEGLVRVWAHEALRLFSDRLVSEEEKQWTDDMINSTALKHFLNIDQQEALSRPILFSNWTSKEELREYSKARLRVFYEEELDVPLVLFNDVLDHVLRIDRVFRQVQVSGSGKTTLSRFVAWMNGLSVFQIKVHNKYSADDFDDDLRTAEKICFIMDESNVLDSGFLERMNTLLANAELASLMTACKEGAQRDGVILDSPDELYRWFTQQVSKNLHNGLASRAATSPALFNRCVLDWFGDWSDQAFYQVGMDHYTPPANFPAVYPIINALVAVHMSMYETNRRLARRQDFINNYVVLFQEQQRHLNIGLDKLRDTVIQVEELRKSLAIKKADAKLAQTVSEQQEAENKRNTSIKIQAALEQQKKDIAERKQVPAVEEAQAAHLTEVRSMANPPEAVKLAMDWKTVQGIIRKDDFIASIVNFDTDRRMTRQLREKMKADFLSRPSASKACGPLCKWVIAQVKFSEILDKVGPLRNEASSTQDQAATMVSMIAELECSIVKSKSEYASLIRETETMKNEMSGVQTKVDRSIKLLESLESEKARWEAGSANFDAQMSTIAGDVLLSSAFMTYGGFFDQSYREAMWQGWVDHLNQASLKYKPELSLAEFLSTADDRLGWQSKSLPPDDLCTENAIMLKRFNRYPLVIDPSGQATTFLMNEYKDRKMTVTSFLDEAFVKSLESALRFGTPLLIQDVEHLDPILNAVLNKELRRAGGRVLIRLGNQDIDFSPAFTMFLSTRDPSVEFSPDICSRVTFVNFTMTRASLQSQSLSQVLRVERPDTDKKRTDLMKLQGEFKLRLRHLEKSLLQALSESTGNILDDDKVIDTLEVLKKEAAEVKTKVEETDIVMKEVDEVTAEYLPLAQASSSVFFVLEQLHVLNHFYQFSLRFFLDIFEFVLLHNPNLSKVDDPTKRLEILLNDLFIITFKRTSRALLHRDHLMLAMLLAQVKLRGLENDIDEEEYTFLLEGGGERSSKYPSVNSDILSQDQIIRLQSFQKLSCFKEVVSNLESESEAWEAFLKSTRPENAIPKVWSTESSATVSTRQLLLLKCFRPERMLSGVGLYVNEIFNIDILGESSYDFEAMVTNEIMPSTPVCLCSVPGYDASYRVENLVASTNSRCASIAMGSQEGYGLADQAISTAIRTGSWVLLKNVHLASNWLSQLEKKLTALNPPKSFRLFLTMETNTGIPVNVLRQSRILMNEPPPGIRANLVDCLKSISPARLSSGPNEKARLYFLLAWFHAVVQERLRYCPLGWSKIYEFNDSDLEAAMSMIDSWITASAKGKSNIDPAQIPWAAMRVLLKQAVYGGRVDSDWDQKLLDSFVDTLFCPASFEVGYHLVQPLEEKKGLLIAEGARLEHFVSWAQALPEREPPHWLSLPPNAEALVAAAQGSELLSRLLKMRRTDEDESVGEAIKQSKALESSGQPAWMRTLAATASEFLKNLSTNLLSLDPAQNDIKDPLFRFFNREVQLGQKLLRIIKSDLQDLIGVCNGNIKQTNHLRALINEFNKGSIPAHWKIYKVNPSMSLAQWLSNFVNRTQQLSRISETNCFNKVTNLGLLFFPDGYLTATRQYVSHQTKVSLEELQLQLYLDDVESETVITETNGFKLEGLMVQGGCMKSAKLTLNSGVDYRPGNAILNWTKELKVSKQSAELPAYLDSSRTQLLFTASLPSEEDPGLLSRRGIAILAAS
ncbi:dynein heavy chain, N-terminal region 1-domain-containing protein [Phakopsora pachyrhizi]|nr:dynein heavy chain, N-terminal region 1-domain-containing protein [Phakopsora pachyrhizi]